jgi:predicted esterase
VPAVLRHTDEPEMTAVFAPKPTLYISVTGDWTAQFPKEEYPHIRTVYEALGATDRVDSKQYDAGHDYNKTMREWMYAWFNKWLKGVDDSQAAVEPDIKPEPLAVLNAMDKPPTDNRGNDGVIAYFLEKFTFKELQPRSRHEWTAYSRRFRERLMDLLGEQFVTDAPLNATTVATTEWRGYKVEKITYTSETEIIVPALLIQDPKPKTQNPKPVVAVLAPNGKSDLLNNHAAFVEDLLQRGFIVFAPDVRLRGELQIKWDLNSVIWGRPEVGMAAHDVKRAVEYLSQRSDVDRRKIFCIGLGEMGVMALVSGVFDNRIAAIVADDLGKTYRTGRERPLMPRLLRYGDLPQIAATLAPRPLWLNRAEPANEFEFSRKAYTAADKSDTLLLPNLPTAAAKKTMVGWLESLSK